MKIVSVKAELAVLRGMCQRDKKIAGTLIQNIDSSYFHNPESVELFESIQKHIGDEGTPPTYRLLLEDPDLSDEAREHMRESQATITTIKDANKATRILGNYRQKRGLVNLAEMITHEFSSSKMDLDDVLQRTSDAITTLRSKKSTDAAFRHMGKNSNSAKLVRSILFDDNSEQIIPTGFKHFDDQSGGFSRGSLVTVGANSGGGKSVTASQLAINFANRGYKVLIVPLEMSEWEMMCRIMANITKTDLTAIINQRISTNDKELVFKKFRRWEKKVKSKGGRYTIFKPPGDLTIEEIMASISAYHTDVVIIDYISLLKGVDGDDQWRALGAVARYAKINAENMNRVNILLCQVSDEGKIRYAGAIREHSSNSWIWVATKESKETGINLIEQLKSRNSKAFPFRVKVQWELMRAKDAPMDDSLGSDPEEESQGKTKDGKKKKKNRELANLSMEPDV